MNPDGHYHWDDSNYYEDGHSNGRKMERVGLAATLTRLRSTAIGQTNDAYIQALDDIADAHNIKSKTVTTVTYTS